jgi:hypothetical protein
VALDGGDDIDPKLVVGLTVSVRPIVKFFLGVSSNLSVAF